MSELNERLTEGLAEIRELQDLEYDGGHCTPHPFDAARETAGQLLDAVEAVLKLHKPERRWQVDIDADVSYDTFGEAQDAGDGSESGVTYFEVCEECKRVEESHDDTHTTDGGYLTSLWPCPTVRAVTDHLGADDE